jgi:hypothetical protein
MKIEDPAKPGDRKDDIHNTRYWEAISRIAQLLFVVRYGTVNSSITWAW